MTERYAMNGFHFAHIVSRLARASRSRRLAISFGLVALGLIVIGSGLARRQSAAQRLRTGSLTPFMPRLPTRLRGTG